MNIVTKFTIATDQGVETLLTLTRQLAFEKYSGIVDAQVLDRYIAENYHRKALIDELNSMSNQWLVVYVDNAPAGYARITTRGKKPHFLDGKRSVRIADFGILDAFPATAIGDSLLEKCLAVCRSHQDVQIWVNEHLESPWIKVFENSGFTRMPGLYELDGLPLQSVCLIA